MRDPHERDPHEEALGSATVLANVAFGLLFAAAVGALFLTVLCAIEVWRFEPLAGAAVVSALPVATLAVHPLAVRLGGRQRLAVGVVTLVAGLAGLALLIGSAPLWMALSMAACGAGFGCVAEALGPHALGRGTARAGSFTTAARHAGLVLGLVVTAPVLAGSLDTGAEDAAAQGVAVVLDAPLDLGVKLGLVDELRTIVLETPAGEVPDVEPVFASAAAEVSPTVAEELDDVEDDLVVAIERALTRAFRSSFLVAAAFAAALAVPGLAALARSRRTSTEPEPVTGGRSGAALGGGALCCVAVALVAAAVGRDAVSVGRYEPADPCSTGGLAGVSLLDGPDVVVQAVGLDALANAACELGTTREWLVLALDPETALGPARGIPEDDIAEALRTGVDTSLTNAEEEGTLPAIVVGIAREALAEVDIVEWIENPTLPDLSG